MNKVEPDAVEPALARTVWERIRGHKGDSEALLAPGRETSSRDDLVVAVESFAQHLLTNGAGSNRPVLVALPQGPEAIVAVLAAISVGSVVPARQDLTAAQLAALIDRCDIACVVVMQGSAAVAVCHQVGVRVMELLPAAANDPAARVSVVDAKPAVSVVPEVLETDHAIILATGGTSGRVKLVPLTHRNLLCSVDNMTRSMGITAADRSLVAMPTIFMHGIGTGVLLLLMNGASVVSVPSADGVVALGADPRLAAGWIEEYEVTFFSASPLFHRGLARLFEQCPADLALRVVRSSSAPLSAELHRRLEEVYQIPVLNSYGMTETSQQICCMPLNGPRVAGTVGIIDGAEVAVLADDGEIGPPGTVGELIVRGDTVMGGYLDDDEANQESFFQDWFRTNDLGRVDPVDNAVTLLGRVDDQINKGGQKISPQLVEQEMRRFPGVRAAAVFPVSHPTLGEDVGAVVVGLVTRDLERLRRYLEEELDPPSVPRVVVVAEQIPRGSMGKVQRAQLSQTLGLGAAGAPEKSAPPPSASVAESAVADLWERVGAVAGRDQSFVAAGGDSLAAIELAALLESELHTSVAVSWLLTGASIREIASVVGSGGPQDRESAEDGQQRMDHADTARVSPAQRRMWIAHRLGAGEGAHNSATRWRIRGGFDPHAFRSAVEDVVQQHATLRSRFSEDDGLVERSIADEVDPFCTFDTEPQDVAAAISAAQFVQDERYDLVTGPLVRVGLWAINDGSWLALLAYHHLVLDGVSRRRVLDDIVRAYRQRVDGDAGTDLGEIPVATHVPNPVSDADVAWWLEALAELPPTLQWQPSPVERDVSSPRVHRVSCELQPESVGAMRALAADSETTVVAVMVAAFGQALATNLSVPRVNVGLTYDGQRSANDRSTGMSADLFVVPVDCGSAYPFETLLDTVSKSCFDGYDHSHVPFERVRQALGIGPADTFVQAVLLQPYASYLPLEHCEVDGRLLAPSAPRADLELNAYLDGPIPEFVFDFDATLVDAGIAEQLANQLLDSMLDSVQSPSRPAGVVGPARTARPVGAQAVGEAPTAKDLARRDAMRELSRRANLGARLSTAELDIAIAAARALNIEIAKIRPEQSLFDHGADSMVAISFLAHLESIIGRRIEGRELLEAQNLNDLAVILQSKAPWPDAPGRLVQLSSADTSRLPVVWLPGDRGALFAVERFVFALDDLPLIYGYEYFGTRPGERALPLVSAIARRAVHDILELPHEGIVVAGNSFGGLVAGQIVARLERVRPGFVKGMLVIDAMTPAVRRRMFQGRRRNAMVSYFRDNLRSRGTAREEAPVRVRRVGLASNVATALSVAGPKRISAPVAVLATSGTQELTGHADLGWSDVAADEVFVQNIMGKHGRLLIYPNTNATAAAVDRALGWLGDRGTADHSAERAPTRRLPDADDDVTVSPTPVQSARLGRDLAKEIVTEKFGERDGELLVGGVGVRELADRFGTPLYLYDGAVLTQQFAALRETLGSRFEIYYSMKANPNSRFVRRLVKLGAGVEIASAGEYLSARRAGCAADAILFAGPGKRDDELELVVTEGIEEIHVESFEEIERLNAIAMKLGQSVRCAVRVNPNSDEDGAGALRMGGVPSPFGFDERHLAAAIAAIGRSERLSFTGVHVYAGTQILDANQLVALWRRSATIASRAAEITGIPLEMLDLGGGLGIPYFAGDTALDLASLKQGVRELLREIDSDPLLRETRLIVEPGRFLAGPSGVYLARVVSTKLSHGQRFVVLDGGMHHHLAASGNLGQVIKRDFPLVHALSVGDQPAGDAVVTGPLCTPLDTLATGATLPELNVGDLVAVLQSGAYGLSASPAGFLSHPMPAEVLVADGEATVIRQRGTLAEPIVPLP